MVILDHQRVSGAKRDDGRRLVPAKQVGLLEIAVLIPLHHVALSVVVARISAVENAAVRAHGGRGRGIVQHTATRHLVSGWIDAQICPRAAPTPRSGWPKKPPRQ